MTVKKKVNTQPEFHEEDEEQRGLIENLYFLVTKSVNSIVGVLVILEKGSNMGESEIDSLERTRKINRMGSELASYKKTQRKFGDIKALKKEFYELIEEDEC